jgi:glutamate--cysteine ligase
MALSENIKSEILSSTVSEQKRKIGLEIEGLYYNSLFNRLPVNPTNQYSATDFIGDIQKNTQFDDPFTYSLEPGGQLEWASAPAISLWNIQNQFNRHVAIEDSLCKKNSIDRLYLSLEPFCKPDDIDLITINKYQLMDNLFKKSGHLGPWMMRNTTSVQLNIDFTSEEDANEMAFLADIIQPLFSILFSNSPFMRGKPVGNTNMRWKIWEDTDLGRCRSLFDHGICSQNKIVDDYSNWLLGVKTIFKYNENGDAEYYDGTLGEMIQSDPNKSKSHILSALHQSFTHVRFKTVLEVRASDRPPKGMEMAPAAFLAGLLTALKTRGKLREAIARWSNNERKALIRSGNNLSFDQVGPQNKTVREWLEFLSDLALNGLDERAANFRIKNERPLLQPFVENVLKNGPKSIQTQNAFERDGGSLKEFLKHYCSDSISQFLS